MPAALCPRPALLSRSLRQAIPTSFRQYQRKHCSEKESTGLQHESLSNAVLNGQSSDRERRNRRDPTPHVVAQTHGRRADFAGENLPGDRSVSRKKSRSEERHKRPEKQQ